MASEPSVRLNKHLALQLGFSRREADEMIAKGQVSINGGTATLGARINPTDTIRVNGKELTHAATYQYVAFHKPVGYVCSRKAQGDTPTIYSLLPAQYHALKPVGRLDKDSSGILLLTNDGDFAFSMTHPSFHKTKVYHVTLDTPLEPLHQQMVSDYGVDLPDGKSQLNLMCLNDDRTQWEVTMSEGRNRQIRRTFAALGYNVIVLHRIQFGSYALGGMKSGGYEPTDIR